MVITLSDLQEYLIWNRGKLASYLIDEIINLPLDKQLTAWECTWQLKIDLGERLHRRYECWLEILPVTTDPNLANNWQKQVKRVSLQLDD